MAEVQEGAMVSKVCDAGSAVAGGSMVQLRGLCWRALLAYGPGSLPLSHAVAGSACHVFAAGFMSRAAQGA